MAKRVNLDAMIPRADFGDLNQSGNQERLQSLGLDALQDQSPILKAIRKPDFQRETNHWSAKQISDLIKSFLDDELVPSLILWDSTTYIFVIDGGHRLSALRAWIADDYGDGFISQRFYNGSISKDQKKAATTARNLVEREIGRFSDLSNLVAQTKAGDPKQLLRANRMFRRVLSLQWVVGSKEVAESSFYKINSQGTALDEVETSLIKDRRKPVAVAARAIVRAGAGHKYWSDFERDAQDRVTKYSADLYKVLFEPEIDSPVRTLELPLGGSVSPVDALALLIDFLCLAGRPQSGYLTINQYDDDTTGSETLSVLKRTMQVVQRMTTNHAGSLGLHPAVYYYSDRGKHSKYLFLGMTDLIARHVKNNNTSFFIKFFSSRRLMEEFLIKHKSLVTLLLQNLHNRVRTSKMTEMFSYLVEHSASGEVAAVEDVLRAIGITANIYDLQIASASREFSEEAMSKTYVGRAIRAALKLSGMRRFVGPKSLGVLRPHRSEA